MKTNYLLPVNPIKITLLLFIFSSSVFSQSAYVRTLNTDFFTVFGTGGSAKKTVSNGKDLVTWNVQSQPGDLARIALMDSAMQVKWCVEYSVLNFVNTSFKIQNITFDENKNLVVCGTASMSTEPCTLLMRLDRSTGAMVWNTVVDSVTGVTAYGADKRIFFFGNKYRQNSTVFHMSSFDSAGSVYSFQFLEYVDGLNGYYHITDAVRLKSDQHLIYLSPEYENKNINRCKIMCVADYMNIIWKRSYAELGYAPYNNKSLIAVNDTEFVVNNFDRDSSLYKFDKKGQLLWGRKYAIGGAASPYVIPGNLLLLSKPEQGGAELLINESTGACAAMNNNLLCEPLVGNYGNSLSYYHSGGVYQFCSAANYFSVANGCAGSALQLPITNFNAVALHHTYAYNGCAYQSNALPSYTVLALSPADSSFNFPNSPLNMFVCNTLVEENLYFNTQHVQDGCGLSLGWLQQTSFDDAFRIFPNPAENKLKLELAESASLQILNVQGQICAEYKDLSETNELDVSFLPAGLYMVKATSGQFVAMKKLIKK